MDFLNDLLMGQQQYQMEQQMVNQQLLEYGNRGTRTKKKDIIDYLQMCSGTNELVQIDDFETDFARHICSDSKLITILPKSVINVPTTEGYLPVEYCLCPNCRLLLVNKTSLGMF